MQTKYIILFLFISVKSFAQDPIFLQPNANAGLLNPAATCLNPKANFQYQFNEFGEQYSIGADFKYNNQRLGINMLIDNMGPNILITKSIMANYAKEIQFSGPTQLHIGVSAQLLMMTASVNVMPDTRLYIPNFSLGTLLLHRNMFLGVATHNVFEPNQSFYHSKGPGTNLPRRWTINMGEKIKVYKELYVLPSIIYQKQGLVDMFLPSLQINCGPIMLGVSKFLSFKYQNTNLVNITIGFINQKLKVSYGYGIAKQDFPFLNTHTISFNYFFKQKNKGSNFSELIRSLL